MLLVGKKGRRIWVQWIGCWGLGFLGVLEVFLLSGDDYFALFFDESLESFFLTSLFGDHFSFPNLFRLFPIPQDPFLHGV
jgi:hypothetical protein